ncbi:transposable element Tcb2 transposase [Trichonephila clavipes]|nr:transposable element Tcb2 transposase [Trichonephila clavipes]
MHVSARTISRRLNQVGLYARKLVHSISLQPRHRRERLRWCKEHVCWDHQNWSKLMFSDDSRFSVTSVILAINYRGESTKFVCERVRYSTGVMMRAGIMHNGRTTHHIFEEALLRNGIAEIILDHVRIFRAAIGPNFLFMDDNAPSHKSIEVSNSLQSENILRMQ